MVGDEAWTLVDTWAAVHIDGVNHVATFRVRLASPEFLPTRLLLDSVIHTPAEDGKIATVLFPSLIDV